MKKQSEIKHFFRPVSNNVHTLNVMKTFEVDKERQAKIKSKEIQLKEKKLKMIEDEQSRLKKSSEKFKAELIALRDEIQVNEPDDFQINALEVFEAIEDVVDIEVTESALKKRKKAWTKRPDCWREIAKHYKDYGLQNTLKAFEEEMHNIPHASKERSVRRWHEDVTKSKTPIYAHRMPEYGEQIDNELYTEAMDRVFLGLTVDATILRELLLVLLNKYDKINLVRNNGSFGLSWAQRFFKRHNLRSRVVTTKMREEIPADFKLKEKIYLEVAARYVLEHDVPKELTYAIDETNALFVTRATRQRVKKGSRRVRAIGVGKEKAQITVTLGACEGTGKMLPTQYIFEGKTDRCHPNDQPLDGKSYFTHTTSHWQTEASFLEYLDKVIVPEKEATIHRLGLPVNQKCILKMDLHFSHKTPAVLERMKLLNILPLYVPAGCTDIMQECDTVINKPFKVGMKREFRDNLHQSFARFREDNPDKRPSEWAPKLKMSDLKPLMVRFVETGLAALDTPEMTQTIIEAFQTDGRFAKIRSPEMQQEMKEIIAMELFEDLNIMVPDEEEEGQNDEEPAIDNLDDESASENSDDESDDESDDDSDQDN